PRLADSTQGPEHRPHVPLTADEMARAIAAPPPLFPTEARPLRAQAVRVGLILFYTAGLRRGELVRLTVGDYDRQAHTLRVRASKFHKSRLLPLSTDALQELEAYLAARRTSRPEATTDDAPLIW